MILKEDFETAITKPNNQPMFPGDLVNIIDNTTRQAAATKQQLNKTTTPHQQEQVVVTRKGPIVKSMEE